MTLKYFYKTGLKAKPKDKCMDLKLLAGKAPILNIWSIQASRHLFKFVPILPQAAASLASEASGCPERGPGRITNEQVQLVLNDRCWFLIAFSGMR